MRFINLVSGYVGGGSRAHAGGSRCSPGGIAPADLGLAGKVFNQGNTILPYSKPFFTQDSRPSNILLSLSLQKEDAVEKGSRGQARRESLKCHLVPKKSLIYQTTARSKVLENHPKQKAANHQRKNDPTTSQPSSSRLTPLQTLFDIEASRHQMLSH